MKELFKRVTRAGVMVSIVLGAAAMAQDPGLPPLPIEQTGKIETLPKNYPEDWFLVHDLSFFHMSDGKVYVLDTSADTVGEQVKGMFNVVLIGNIAQSHRRGEIYATESIHSRGTRGTRLDILTIWDKETLTVKDEVLWPIPKRYVGLPLRYALTPIDNDNFLLAANFTPATSVAVINLDTREIVNEVATPGCAFAFPTGKRGFSSLCADGRFMSTELAKDGSLIKQTRTEAFFSSDDTPVFPDAALIDGTAYIPTFKGDIFPVNMKGKVAKVGKPWHLATEEERAANWRPGGLGLIDRDDHGRIYVLMHPDGGDGSHQSGGSEVWVFDAEKQKRVLKIPMQVWGLSLAVSHGKNPKLLVTNPTDMSLELYDGTSGEFIRTIKDFGQETPMMLHASSQD
jgi:methylamine dehydrogenase heavy chain